MTAATRPARWKILLAFGIIYVVWGSTYLAIRVGVAQVPPFLLAASRFTVAGLVLYGWLRLRGTPSPTLRQWASAGLLGTLVFVLDYGCLFWAEQRVPSGIAAVVLATIPVFITLLEIAFLKTQRLSARLSLGLLVGLLGVAVLVNNKLTMGEAPLDHEGALALLVAALGWSVGTILTRKLPLPSNKVMSAAAQQLSGGLQLFVLTAITGEFSQFQWSKVTWAGWFSFFYLLIFGSWIGFTAYIWLLHHESPTKVGTYAYVNPVVAVAIGYFLGGEKIGGRTLLGMLLVLVSVAAITTIRAHSPQPQPKDQEEFANLPAAVEGD